MKSKRRLSGKLLKNISFLSFGLTTRRRSRLPRRISPERVILNQVEEVRRRMTRPRKQGDRTMKRSDLTEKLLDIKREKEWSWKPSAKSSAAVPKC